MRFPFSKYIIMLHHVMSNTSGHFAEVAGWKWFFFCACRGVESHIPDMTADDVLGLMIATVILAQPHCMVSLLEYVKAFHTSGDWAGQTGFQVRLQTLRLSMVICCIELACLFPGHCKPDAMFLKCRLPPWRLQLLFYCSRLLLKGFQQQQVQGVGQR